MRRWYISEDHLLKTIWFFCCVQLIQTRATHFYDYYNKISVVDPNRLCTEPVPDPGSHVYSDSDLGRSRTRSGSDVNL